MKYKLFNFCILSQFSTTNFSFFQSILYVHLYLNVISKSYRKIQFWIIDILLILVWVQILSKYKKSLQCSVMSKIFFTEYWNWFCLINSSLSASKFYFLLNFHIYHNFPPNDFPFFYQLYIFLDKWEVINLLIRKYIKILFSPN